MNEQPSHDHPFALWRVFQDAPSWWFAHGCPPTVSSLQGFTRALHASVLVGASGTAAVVIGAFAMWIASLIGLGGQWPFTLVGAAFGGCTLLPLSRWVGRPWWLAGLSVVWAAAWFVQGEAIWNFWETTFSGVHQGIFDGLPAWIGTTSMLGFGISAWMISPTRRWTWSIPFAAVLASVLSASSFAAMRWIEADPTMLQVIANPIVMFVLGIQPLVIFMTLIAIALGMRLWRDEAATDVSEKNTVG